MQRSINRLSVRRSMFVVPALLVCLLLAVAVQAADQQPASTKQEPVGAKGDPGQVQERAIGGGFGGGLGFTCTDTIEGGRSCTCTNTADCIRLDASGKCDSKVTCPAGSTICTCPWKKPARLQTRPNMTAPRPNLAPSVAR